MNNNLVLDAHSRVVVIGLDGASVDLIEKWVGQGKLPNLAGLMRKGVYGRLESSPNMNSASAWTSMMTGQNPGKHGIYYFYEKVYGTYDVRYLNGGDRKSETLWSILSRCGKKVGVINVPMTYPVEEVNGFMISGLDAPGLESPGAVYPESLHDDLLHNVNDYVIQPGIPGLVAANKLDEAVERGLKAIDARMEASLYCMDKFDWDFFMVVFTEIDAVQHLFWKYMDKSYEGHDHEGAEKYGEVIYRFYQKCDEAVGKIVSSLPPETSVIIHSDHGAGPAEKGPCYLNSFLKSLRLLEFTVNTQGIKGSLSRIKRSCFQEAFSLIHKYTSRQTKEQLMKLFPKLRDRIETGRFFANIDWPRTRVFGESSRIELWVNQKGRELHGTVEEGAEYEALIDYVKDKLHSWHDPKSGKKVVKDVFRKEEIYHGEYAHAAPDILIIFNNDLMVSGVSFKDKDSGKLVIADVTAPMEDHNKINGVHNDNGYYLISGKDIKHGTRLDGVKITSLTPTVLFLLGQAIPENMDGNVIEKAFIHRVDYETRDLNGNTENKNVQKKKDYSDEEVQIIKERLKGLGYIE